MPNYHVQIFREMRLHFPNIEAAAPEAAADIAAGMAAEDAASISDCDGVNLGALVDLDGDHDHEHTRMIDFPNPDSEAASCN